MEVASMAEGLISEERRCDYLEYVEVGEEG
jgi:hypothetical protein